MNEDTSYGSDYKTKSELILEYTKQVLGEKKNSLSKKYVEDNRYFYVDGVGYIASKFKYYYNLAPKKCNKIDSSLHFKGGGKVEILFKKTKIKFYCPSCLFSSFSFLKYIIGSYYLIKI